PVRTSTCLNFVTISSGFGRLLAMCFLRFPKHSGGPLQWGRITPEKVNSFTMQISLGLPDTEFTRFESELREMVVLRNKLVHHFIDQHDLSSSDGCRGAQDALVTAYNLIDQQFAQLREWAKGTESARQALLEFLQSERGKDLFVNGISADGTVNWDASGIVSALREAFGALAVDGWAPVAETGKWIVKRYPEQLPAKYGCQSWRQVVHETPTLDLRYFEMHGQRTAYFRVRENSAKPL
ncbi:OST-HTH/LOTUS domain-containing protein, partial [Shimia aestuarii]|uniref:OST-HTH/LOTUS domain-containing protein n=1 Tax=Shimia aestuarii TaxID=254406 RepID=UPI001FB22CC9